MDLQHAYVEGQMRPHFPALLARFQAESDEAAASPGTALDLPYGPHPRQRFDHFPAIAPACGTLLYLHAGYWQSRDKSQFRFVAPGLQRRGFHVVLVNYPLCPEVSLPDLVQAVRPCVRAVREHLGNDRLPLVVAGHSAGAHLAVELALAGDARIDGVLGISGVYDPQPLLATTLNAKLNLDARTAAACDVTARVRDGRIPGLWVVGGDETGAFLAQNARMHAAWSATGHWSRELVVPQADHFTVLDAWVDGTGGWDDAFAAWQPLVGWRASGR
ncbi:alpha/beta hydrolase [Ramlibacter sp. USB13]|uniref:Alpha/beta hydrolase n=1 Tax=Ramlibacter cellulosilyticus TaxID=2764187 RepID=A0A923MKX0_9BURK|nr:alpha/beta hydrolase [Ramlibacter cellulosilyticus]MBC5781502.1 alpha/beta hydrolase [Ramlibacter cellulosilyticus]